MAYGDFKNLPKKTAYKVLRDKASDVAKNLKYDVYQHGLTSVVWRFFQEKYATHEWKWINSDAVSDNQQLAKELHNPIIRKNKRLKYFPPLGTRIGVLKQ